MKSTSGDEAGVKKVFELLKALESILHRVQRLLKRGLSKLKVRILKLNCKAKEN